MALDPTPPRSHRSKSSISGDDQCFEERRHGRHHARDGSCDDLCPAA